jgi:hypothetical protein
VANSNAAYELFESMPTFVLVSTINALISVLHNRGVVVTDWDDRRKDVRGMKLYGNTAYILAPPTRPVHSKPGGMDGREE